MRGTVNLTSKIPKGHFGVHMDSGATITVIGNKNNDFVVVSNKRAAPKGDVVMMNAHPEPVPKAM